jgi:hypothetical protein
VATVNPAAFLPINHQSVMKKCFLLMAALFLFAWTAQAQVYLIPKAGITSSNVNFDQDLPNQKSNTAFVGGLGVSFPITSDNFVAIQPELLYIQKGFRAGNYMSVANTRINYNYLEVPLLLKVNFGEEMFKAFVNAGPSFGYALGGRFRGDNQDMKVRFGNDASTTDITYLNPDNYNRLDIGLQFGIGAGIAAGPGDLTLEARYGIGLTDFSNVSGHPDSFNKSKNRVIALMLGYAIPFGGR